MSVNPSRLSPLPAELVALYYGGDANHDIPRATVTRPSFKIGHHLPQSFVMILQMMY
ncbi:hypothetical protein SLEP1_g59220 [Rubroshorea leprosula]|uniref:Uncharacterized protein n=1 Tax=Rubroshorea leprosula TaxID=152421 RepID=A0AAV5MVS0_9ROSI|nr:hypothetical protein SLEP1_g59220 [Rubroshorea leprosula]